MSEHVFVVSEWLAKKGHEEELWEVLQKIMATTREREKGCIRAHATKQISHPGAPSKSKYQFVLLQEYVNLEAFDVHCNAQYVKEVAKKYVEDETTSIVEDWSVRLFGEK